MPPRKPPEPLPNARLIAAEVIIEGPGATTPPDSVFEILREAYAASVAAHQFIYTCILACENKLSTMAIEELTDCSFAMRETAERLVDTEKECNKLLKQLARVCCEKWCTDPDSEEKINGDYATGHPKLRKVMAIPSLKDDPEGYQMLMDWLGVAPDLRDSGKMIFQETGEITTEVLKINFTGFQDYIECLRVQGHELPTEITSRAKFKEWIEHHLKVVKKRNLLP